MNLRDHQSGIFTKQFGYKSFSPNSINFEWNINSPEINTLLEDANLHLGELNAFSSFVPDVNVFIRMHIVKEATQSSRIEGTRTRMDEAVLEAKDISPESKDDWQEVQNYIEAINFSIDQLEKLPLSSRLIKDAHKILLKGVRGKNKLPGEFRSSQNWIGGASINDASFIPPHFSQVDECISDLEKFLNNDQIKVPHLIRIGIAHYQFEAIHPFLDGNGRIGRLLVTLYLINQKVLTKPTLYLSDFIEKHRSIYYDNLMGVSIHNNLEQWLKFFLVGIIETAKNAILTFTKIIALRDQVEKDTIMSLGKKLPNARALLQFLYSKPVITVSDVIEVLNTSKQSANALIKDFCNLGILTEQTGYKRNRIFTFTEYLKLFQE
ncbi:Fic family protein [Pedobacter sp. MC2016-15]|uniref:Fic family protein n=1 Tax=Pedobacter sp. MC2016-15 TaxID=2994473 RepID=UPI002245E258|nr:Fic family protein [Pedobacter sp. MC2016-15]MCX2478110.1 Fic family protein [Pedobacter sp. MC2016-15]